VNCRRPWALGVIRGRANRSAVDWSSRNNDSDRREVRFVDVYNKTIAFLFCVLFVVCQRLEAKPAATPEPVVIEKSDADSLDHPPMKRRPKQHRHHHISCHCGRPAPLLCTDGWDDFGFVDSTVGNFPILTGDWSSGASASTDEGFVFGSNGVSGSSSVNAVTNRTTRTVVSHPATNVDFWNSYNSTTNNNRTTVIEDTEWSPEKLCASQVGKIETVPDNLPAPFVWLSIGLVFVAYGFFRLFAIRCG
jgi:hypothetical protein